MKILLKKWNFGFHELNALGNVVSGLNLGFDKNKVAAVLLKPIPHNKKEIMSFLGVPSYYRQHLKGFAIHARSLYRICDQQTVFQITQERIQAYNKIKYALTYAPLLLIPDWKLSFKLYIDACGEGLGTALHQVQLVNDKPYEDPVFLFQDKLNLQRPGIEQAKWVITDCNSVKSLLNIKAPNRNMLIWKIALQEYRGNMTIVHKSGDIHKSADGLSRWALTITPNNPVYVPENEESKIPIEGINITDVGAQFLEEIREIYKQDKNCHILTSLLYKY
ncbi:hypothetical protein O181_082736 [Austropuccinia psidii MF-1]|uniref:Reverse transcriptase/retrotransposon-derived protein RNase H-like domain-containing protein n=1 Tax=Austropuccinia psidii MF-1 TaxID=1389203 RepID=A0A9Q3FT75_9BASI|nr:hypothetical protein [Austropuccinia psidii MF-1]